MTASMCGAVLCVLVGAAAVAPHRRYTVPASQHATPRFGARDFGSLPSARRGSASCGVRMLRREVGDSTNASWTDLRRMGCAYGPWDLLWGRLKIVSTTFYSLPARCRDSGGSSKAPCVTVTGTLQPRHVLWHAGRHHAQVEQSAQRGPTSTSLSCSFTIGQTGA